MTLSLQIRYTDAETDGVECDVSAGRLHHLQAAE